MAEITPDEKFNYKNKLGWNYIGKNSKGEPKFRRYIDQTLEDVKKYLDAKGLQYLVHEDIACMLAPGLMLACRREWAWRRISQHGRAYRGMAQHNIAKHGNT